MKRIAFLIAISSCCAWSQSLDLSSLDKLDSKAKEVNRVSVNGEQLRAAMQMADQAGVAKEQLSEAKKMMDGLQAVEVRNYEFEQEGQYSESDLEAVRSQLAKLKGCSKIVDSKEKNERSEVYMCSEAGKTTGLAVISAEAKELSIVFVRGPVNMKDLGKLHGAMGLPNIQLSPGGKGDKKVEE